MNFFPIAASDEAAKIAPRLSRAPNSSAEARPSLIFGLLAAFLTVALLPFALCSPLPLPDYQNHMARMYIIAQLHNSQLLQRYYEVHWQIIPNLAQDLVVPQLARLMPVQSAMLIFAALTLLLLVVGCFAVHRVLFGKPSYAPIAVFLFLYSRQFLFGMLNFLFSLGLALLTFALWVAWRRKTLLLRCGVFLPLACLVFICHLAGLGVLGVLIAGYELHRFLQEKDGRTLLKSASVVVVAFGVPVLLFILSSPLHTRGTPGEAWEFRVRAVGLLEPFNNYNVTLDISTLIFVVAAVGLALLTGKARLHRHMLVPLISIAIIYCIIPSRLLGSYYADRRLVTALFLVLVCSLEWEARPQWVVAVIALVFLVRMGFIATNWRAINGVYQANLAVIDHIPPGAKVATAVGVTIYPALNNPPLGHLPAMAIIRRQVLINSVYAGYGYEMLRLKPEYQEMLYEHLYLADNCSAPPAKVSSILHRIRTVLSGCAEDATNPSITAANPFQNIPLNQFDYLLLVNNRYFRYPVPDTLRPIYARADTILYQIAH